MDLQSFFAGIVWAFAGIAALSWLDARWQVASHWLRKPGATGAGVFVLGLVAWPVPLVAGLAVRTARRLRSRVV